MSRWVAGIAVVALSVGFIATADLDVAGTGDSASPVEPATDDGLDVVTPDESRSELRRIATRLFEARARALLGGDRVAFMRQVDDGDPQFRRRQSMLFANVQKLPFDELSYAVTTVQSASANEAYGVPTFVPWVRASHQLAGYDARPVGALLAYTLVRRDSGWQIVSDSDVEPGDRRLEPWDLAPLRVHDDGSLLVVTDADQASRLRRAVRLGRRAIETIDRTLPLDWSRQIVLYAVTDPTLFQEYQGADFAALTMWFGSGVHRVLVNLESPNLNAAVVTHEATHAALGRYVRVPMWLHEGVATYVESQEYTVPGRRRYAAAFADRAREAEVALPGSATFSAYSDDVAWSYVQSWMACEYVAEKYGTSRLLDLVRAMDSRRHLASLDARQDDVLVRVLDVDGDRLAERASTYLLDTYAE